MTKINSITWYAGGINNEVDIASAFHLDAERKTFINSFFRDNNRDGEFEYYQHQGNLVPDRFSEKIAGWGSNKRSYMIALGGAGWKWETPKNVEKWKENAVKSLKAILDKGYSGIDLNYEDGISASAEKENPEKFKEDVKSFIECMSYVISKLKETNPNLVISIAPYVQTWEKAYLPLFKNCRDNIDYVNYQIYVELDYYQDFNQAKEVCKQVANEVTWEKFVLGVSSMPNSMNNQEKDKFAELVKYVVNEGSKGIFVWSLENSIGNNYENEKFISAIEVPTKHSEL